AGPVLRMTAVAMQMPDAKPPMNVPDPFTVLAEYVAFETETPVPRMVPVSTVGSLVGVTVRAEASVASRMAATNRRAILTGVIGHLLDRRMTQRCRITRAAEKATRVRRVTETGRGEPAGL